VGVQKAARNLNSLFGFAVALFGSFLFNGCETASPSPLNSGAYN
jgi:hypothetical protein